jgi:tetratricopeptide (TPR) repeat protein
MNSARIITRSASRPTTTTKTKINKSKIINTSNSTETMITRRNRTSINVIHSNNNNIRGTRQRTRALLLNTNESIINDIATQSLQQTTTTPTTNNVLSELSALEGNIQGFYLGTLLLILGFSGFIVVRQVFIRRELDDQAKKTGERIRAGNATADDYFEMGSIMLRKKVYTQAIRNLQLAAENWDGDEEDLAQVHNALGFGYAEMEKWEDAIKEFKLASKLQPGYVTVWNNLGDAYEKIKMQKEALQCYEEALVLAPGNSVATMRLKNLRERAERLGLTIE